MGAFHRPNLELRHGTHLKSGFLPESSPRVEQPFPDVYFYDHNRFQDFAADFSRQICGQITPQISRFKASDSSGFIRLFRHFIY
jgi:hypothetical protein